MASEILNQYSDLLFSIPSYKGEFPIRLTLLSLSKEKFLVDSSSIGQVYMNAVKNLRAERDRSKTCKNVFQEYILT